MHPLRERDSHPLEGLYQARDALGQANHDIPAGGVAPADQPAYGQAVTGVQTALAELERTLAAAGITDPRPSHVDPPSARSCSMVAFGEASEGHRADP